MTAELVTPAPPPEDGPGSVTMRTEAFRRMVDHLGQLRLENARLRDANQELRNENERYRFILEERARADSEPKALPIMPGTDRCAVLEHAQRREA